MPGPAGMIKQRLGSVGSASGVDSSAGSSPATSTSGYNGNNSIVPKSRHHRVVVMGAARVGKTALIHQFLYDNFVPCYRETVEELHRGEYEVNGCSLTLDILDTSGAFQFPAMRALSISSADAFLLVFAVNDAASWEEVRVLREQIIEAKKTPQVPIVVVGAKCDLKKTRQVSQELAETVVTIDWEHGYVECSSKENDGVVQVFKELLSQAKIHYNLSPAVKRRRQSYPTYGASGSHSKSVVGNSSAGNSKIQKRNSCNVS